MENSSLEALERGNLTEHYAEPAQLRSALLNIPAASSQIESVEDFIVYIDRDEGMPKLCPDASSFHRNSRVGYSFRFLDDSIVVPLL